MFDQESEGTDRRIDIITELMITFGNRQEFFLGTILDRTDNILFLRQIDACSQKCQVLSMGPKRLVLTLAIRN